MRTQPIAVMPNVASVPRRPSAMLAKAASTLAILTGVRVILGVCAGDPKVVRAYGARTWIPTDASIRSRHGCVSEWATTPREASSCVSSHP